MCRYWAKHIDMTGRNNYTWIQLNNEYIFTVKPERSGDTKL